MERNTRRLEIIAEEINDIQSAIVAHEKLLLSEPLSFSLKIAYTSLCERRNMLFAELASVQNELERPEL